MNAHTFTNYLGHDDTVKPGNLLLFYNDYMTGRIVNIDDGTITIRWTHHEGVDTYSLDNLFCQMNVSHSQLRKTNRAIAGSDGVDTTVELRKLLIS